MTLNEMTCFSDFCCAGVQCGGIATQAICKKPETTIRKGVLLTYHHVPLAVRQLVYGYWII